MEEFKEGDIVSLKSDQNAVFTLAAFLSIDGVRHARVYWYYHTQQELKFANIPVHALKK